MWYLAPLSFFFYYLFFYLKNQDIPLKFYKNMLDIMQSARKCGIFNYFTFIEKKNYLYNYVKSM